MTLGCMKSRPTIKGAKSPHPKHRTLITPPYQTPIDHSRKKVLIMPETSRYLALRELQDLTDDSNSCYVCARMRLSKPGLKQTSLSKTCLLCSNPFCDTHKSKTDDGVCEINHRKYCSSPGHVD